MFADGCRWLRYTSKPSDILDLWLCFEVFTAVCPWVIKSPLSPRIKHNLLRQCKNTRSSTSQQQTEISGLPLEARARKWNKTILKMYKNNIYVWHTTLLGDPMAALNHLFLVLWIYE